MSQEQVTVETDESGPLDTFRQFFALERDVLVLVLSLAMFAFSLGFQMTSRFLPEYMVALGASGFVVGLFGTVGNIISAVFPYPGGAISDRVGSRYALTLFGLISTLGFGVWLVAPSLGVITIAGVTIQPWIWIFVGLLLAQGWKSFGLGATFAVVKQATSSASAPPPARNSSRRSRVGTRCWTRRGPKPDRPTARIASGSTSSHLR
jgi:MFS family permease